MAALFCNNKFYVTEFIEFSCHWIRWIQWKQLGKTPILSLGKIVVMKQPSQFHFWTCARNISFLSWWFCWLKRASSARTILCTCPSPKWKRYTNVKIVRLFYSLIVSLYIHVFRPTYILTEKPNGFTGTAKALILAFAVYCIYAQSIYVAVIVVKCYSRHPFPAFFSVYHISTYKFPQLCVKNHNGTLSKSKYLKIPVKVCVENTKRNIWALMKFGLKFGIV